MKQQIAAIKSVMQRAPNEIGAIAVAHYKQNFVLGGFVDDTLRPWKKRKKETKQTLGRALLVKRAKLKNSIRVFSKNEQQIVLGSDVVYARIHNEGGVITQYERSELFVRNRNKKGFYKKGIKAGKGNTYGKRTIRIPKRQFIGDSIALRRKMDKWYLQNLKAANVIN